MTQRKKHHHHQNGNGLAHKKEVVEQQRNGHVNESENAPTSFVTRMTSLPILKDSITTVHDYANKSSIGRYALSTAESTYESAKKYSSQQPYVQNAYQTYVQPQLEKADALGCKSLDFLETKVPLVTKPTNEIVDTIKKPSYAYIDGVKVKIDTTITQVTAPATNAAKGVNRRLSLVIDNVAATVDKYLPPTEQVGASEGKATSDNKDTSAEGENQAVRAYKLAGSVSTRLRERVQTTITTASAHVPRSRQDVVNETNFVLQSAQDQVRNLNATLIQWIHLSTQAAQQRIPPSITEGVHSMSVTTNQRLNDITHQLATQLTGLVSFVQTHSPSLPPFLQQRLQPIFDLASNEYEIVRAEYEKPDLTNVQKAKNIVQVLQNQLLPFLQNLQSHLHQYADLTRKNIANDLRTRLETIGVIQTQ
ncbi:hypothetical protein K450DRAFT_279169 [Umbelopsis ramanniana AG]|uniref:Uncharacterized protein n=1 Tax=Umbelopsis ramanniana AG TaxID=1314678 RepID=A0AAD5ECX1_UMBRA|nr:uncharacterized protein K450DRAFT_279169 [Umbelopsis ramanniana AG]KAI8581393.1 hypothetical protein K450DRAFT_279169 [Umbelopsis ramanniana AG]